MHLLFGEAKLRLPQDRPRKAWMSDVKCREAWLSFLSPGSGVDFVALKHISKPFKIEALFSLAFSIRESSLFFEGRSRGNLGAAGLLRLA